MKFQKFSCLKGNFVAPLHARDLGDGFVHEILKTRGRKGADGANGEIAPSTATDVSPCSTRKPGQLRTTSEFLVTSRTTALSYADYYNSVRTHRSLNKDAPVSRPVQRTGVISSRAILGGLHHRYVRV